MNHRVRIISSPQKHLKKIQSLWNNDIDNIRNSWWYANLSLGNKRFLSYRLSLIQIIVKQAIAPGESITYKFGNDAMAWVSNWNGYRWVGGIAIRPTLLSEISGVSSGLGSKMLSFIEQDAIRNNVYEVRLTVGHKGLIGYYENKGYKYWGVMSKIGRIWYKNLRRDNESN